IPASSNASSIGCSRPASPCAASRSPRHNTAIRRATTFSLPDQQAWRLVPARCRPEYNSPAPESVRLRESLTHGGVEHALGDGREVAVGKRDTPCCDNRAERGPGDHVTRIVSSDIHTRKEHHQGGDNRHVADLADSEEQSNRHGAGND